MSSTRIILNNLSFHIDNTSVAFNDISLSFEAKKYGVVGDNGSGKTTFLKLLSRQLAPEIGSVHCNGTLLYLPQSHNGITEHASIADVLGLSVILNTMQRIQSGNYDNNDFDLADSQWNIATRIENALTFFNITTIDIHSKFSLLSGGQKTKILLAKTLIFESDFILMDEPTNNLDKQSREILYQFIESSENGIIVVSHDRRLLNKMDCIIEINTKKIENYGGNYDFYRSQKNIEQSALEKNYGEAKGAIHNASKSMQSTREKHQRLASRGRKAFCEGHVDKLTARSKQGRSEKSKTRMATQEEKIISQNNIMIAEIREKIEIKQCITASLDETFVPNGKTVLEIKDLNFKYSGQDNFLIQNFNFELIGSERVAITGENGCGKSTLIQLVRHQLRPTSGLIKIRVDHIAYLDQSISFLNHDQTLIENFLSINPEAKIFDAYSKLAEFQFRNKEAEKKVYALSGGERMRAGLAISLMSWHPPQLIILDEPTNHLDLRSIEAIESLLQAYKGAIVAVSHDEDFLTHIGITRMINMSQSSV